MPRSTSPDGKVLVESFTTDTIRMLMQMMIMMMMKTKKVFRYITLHHVDVYTEAIPKSASD